jgi:hypothetical protein
MLIMKRATVLAALFCCQVPVGSGMCDRDDSAEAICGIMQVNMPPTCRSNKSLEEQRPES